MTAATGQNAQLAARVRRARRGRAVARALVGVELALVALPLAIIAVWAFTDAWPWPDLWPQQLSARGIEQALSGRQNAGVQTLALSIGIAAATAVVSTAAAALACRALCHFQWRGRSAFQFAALLPFIIPSTVFAMGVQVVFLQAGLARTVPGVVLAHSIVALPYAIIIMTDITRAAARMPRARSGRAPGRCCATSPYRSSCRASSRRCRCATSCRSRSTS